MNISALEAPALESIPVLSSFTKKCLDHENTIHKVAKIAGICFLGSSIGLISFIQGFPAFTAVFLPPLLLVGVALVVGVIGYIWYTKHTQSIKSEASKYLLPILIYFKAQPPPEFAERIHEVGKYAETISFDFQKLFENYLTINEEEKINIFKQLLFLCPNAKTINIAHLKSLDPALLQLLCPKPLESIEFSNSQIEDQMLAQLAEVKSIKSISLKNCPYLTKQGLNAFREHSIEKLTLQFCRFDAQLIAHWKNLKELSITHIDDSFLSDIVPQLSKLKYLSVFYATPSFKGIGFEQLKNHPQLQKIVIDHCHGLSAIGLQFLCEMKNLKQVDFPSELKEFTSLSKKSLSICYQAFNCTFWPQYESKSENDKESSKDKSARQSFQACWIRRGAND